MAHGARGAYTIGPDEPAQGPTSQLERGLASRRNSMRTQPTTPLTDRVTGYTYRLQAWASPIGRRQISNKPNSDLQLQRTGGPLPIASGSTLSGKVTVNPGLWTVAATRIPWLPM